MASKSKIAQLNKMKRSPKYNVKQYNRCSRCGRKRAYMRQFDLCRICFRELAHEGELPGVKKASW